LEVLDSEAEKLIILNKDSIETMNLEIEEQNLLNKSEN
jgi:hypothetical protein